jgi:hypothetical protein
LGFWGGSGWGGVGVGMGDWDGYKTRAHFAPFVTDENFCKKILTEHG